MMKKKLMAVAVGAALAAPALSYAAVEISGRANVGLGQWSATGSTAGSANDLKSRMRVWDSGSNITIKANEDLGGGLKAEVYLETGINVDQGDANTQGGVANSATGSFGSRQGWAGLSGNFGKILVGKMNTWYGSGDQDLTQAVYLNEGIQFATGNIAAAPLVSRLTNAVRYNSPMMGPVEVLVTYSPTSETAAQGANADGNVLALTVQGSQGPISGGFDWTKNKSAAPATGSAAERTATKERIGFKYQPGAQVSLILVQGSVKAAVSGTETKQTAWQINWEHQAGNIGLHAGLGQTSKVSVGGADVADSATKAMQFGVRFIMSKTVYTYVNYIAYTNENNAALDFNAGGMSSAANAGGIGALAASMAGADPKELAVGISYRF